MRNEFEVYSGLTKGVRQKSSGKKRFLHVLLFYRQKACFATTAAGRSSRQFFGLSLTQMLTSGSEPFRPAARPTSTPVAEKEENRRIPRISLPLPVRVEVRIDGTVNWSEITRLSDVSAYGAGFTMKRPIKRGRLILMTIPMPRQLRSFDYSETQYKIWAVVRRCISTGKSFQSPEYSIGVGFVGKSPPTGYFERPSTLYDISQRSDEGAGFWQLSPADVIADDSDLPTDLRKQTRFHIPEALLIEKLDDARNVLESEMTVTENISLGGAAVLTSLQTEPGAFLRVTSERFKVTILSVVRGYRVGPDGMTRLHLEFIDRLFPLEGID